MTQLFEPAEINGLKLKNRFVRSATWEGMADDDGFVTDKLIEYYRILGRGGIGLTIASYTYISPEGKGLPGSMGLFSDSQIEGHRSLTDSVHEEGGKIILQICHTGGQANPDWTGFDAIAPSAVADDAYRDIPGEMSKADLQRVKEQFGAAAARAVDAGYDGVQLHGAHGFLLSQFITPCRNRRNDEFGGSLENRSRYPAEVYETVRERVGPDYPVMIKLNCDDFMENGGAVEDYLYTARLLAEKGLDAVELSGGTPASGPRGAVRTGIDEKTDEAYFSEEARIFREHLDIPLMLVGGIRSFDIADDLLEEGTADYISMSRPFIREPELIGRWESGDRSPASCISCNRCYKAGMSEEGLHCPVERESR